MLSLIALSWKACYQGVDDIQRRLDLRNQVILVVYIKLFKEKKYHPEPETTLHD